jgi:beta-glucosidase
LKHLAGNSESINGHDRVESQLSIRYLQHVLLPRVQGRHRRGREDGDGQFFVDQRCACDRVLLPPNHTATTASRFHGVTISDYKDVQALQTTYHVAPDMAAAIAIAVNAGLDMAMWVDDPDAWQSNILADVREGTISQTRIDDAVRRILGLKLELGLFDQPCVTDASQQCVDPDTAATRVKDGREATLRSARESITLLKNTDNLLPLPVGAKLLVTGPNADSMVSQLGG